MVAQVSQIDPSGLLARLEFRLREVVPFESGLTSVTMTLPELADVPLPRALPGGWCWSRPDQGVSLIGWGEALRHEAADLSAVAAFLKDLPWHHQALGGETPRAFLGHGFGTLQGGCLPAALLLVPQLLLSRQRGRTTLTLSHAGNAPRRSVIAAWLAEMERFWAVLLAADPSPLAAMAENRLAEAPDPDLFKARVRSVTQAIALGRVEKAVLSRRVTVVRARPFDPARLATSLALRHPGCAILAASFGARMLVAASPERLVARHGPHLESHALAGTAPFDADQPFLGRRLLSSVKDRHEHALVVAWIARIMAGMCDRVDVPSEPRLMTLGGLQHLWTPIRGVLRQGGGLLAAASRLHPTPAVAGLPLAAARSLLAELGESREDWYSGAAGWIDRAGDGELSVVLRCAMLDGHQASLAAGAGIVAGSDPEAELAETELKLRAMLDSLQVA